MEKLKHSKGAVEAIESLIRKMPAQWGWRKGDGDPGGQELGLSLDVMHDGDSTTTRDTT